MANAQITLPGGIAITVEGSVDEIVAVVERLKEGGAATEPSRTRGLKRTLREGANIGDLVMSLLRDGFFKPPKELGEVRTALAQMGHHYPRTTLSPLLLRLVRKRDLRRLQQGGRWVYTN